MFGISVYDTSHLLYINIYIQATYDNFDSLCGFLCTACFYGGHQYIIDVKSDFSTFSVNFTVN